MENDELKNALKQVLDIELEYFDLDELQSTQKKAIVTKIIKVIKDRKEDSNDTQDN